MLVDNGHFSATRSERCQSLLRVRRVPPDVPIKVSRNDPRCVVAAQPGDVASGMRRAAAQIQARNGCAITARAGEGAMGPNLVVGKRADQQGSLSPIG